MREGLDRRLDVHGPGSSAVRWAVTAYLALQGGGALVWWGLLFSWPASRTLFRATNAPDATLLAFAVADLTLFVGGSLLAAVGLAAQRAWAWPVLCVHTGAAVYAAMYCLTLWCLDAHAWVGGVMMLPSLVAPPLITWHYRPRNKAPC